MVNYKPDRTDMGLWVICSAIGDDHEKAKQMKKNEDGTYPIVFSIGGVELDFDKVVKRLDEDLDRLVERKAQKLIDLRYEDLIKDIHDIQERLEYHKDRLKYEWEEDDDTNDKYHKMAEFVVQNSIDDCDFCKAIEMCGDNSCCDDKRWCVKGVAEYLRERKILEKE